MPAPLVPTEPARLAALCGLGVLDTPPEAAFDDLTRLAAAVCDTPIALVSLVDSCRQWFKSRHGLDATETPRDVAFCAHAITQPGLFIIPDAAADERFRDNPLVTGGPKIRFYAGAPLVTEVGHAVGTLCVIDSKPRTLTAAQEDALRVLARQVVAQLLLRQQLHSTRAELKAHETFRVLFESSSDAHLLFHEDDGAFDCNAAAVAALRCKDKSEVLGIHPALLSPEFQPDGRRSAEKGPEMAAIARRNGYHRFDWVHRRADGEDFPCEITLTAALLHGRSVLVSVWHDLTERKRAEDALRETEQRFRAVVDELAEGVVLLDYETRAVLRANRAFAAMLGYTSAEVAALTQYQFVAHDPADIDERMRQIITTGRHDLGYRKYRRKDGSVFDVTVNGSRLTFAGRPVLCLAVRDMTAEKRAEDALRASEERFRAFMDNSPALAYMKDADGRFVYVNGPVCERFGIPEDGWLGRTDADLLAPEVASVIRRTDVQVLAGSETVKVLENAPTPDGTGQHWQSYKFPLTDASGRRFLAGMSVDVTAEKRAEDALRESEERFREAFENAAIGMALVAPDGRWLRVNLALCEMIGYTPDELLATDFQAVTHPDDLTTDLEQVRQVLAGEIASYQMEKRYFHKDGRVVHALLAVSLVRGSDGEPVHFVSQIKDITASKRAEDGLRASEAKFRATLDRLAEGVLVIDPTVYRFVEVNAALLSMLGYTAAEFLALGMADIIAQEPPEVIARNMRHVETQLAAAGRCDLGRKHLRRKDGSAVPVDVRMTLVPNGGAGLHAVVIKDISEQVEHEDRLFEYQSQLEDANQKLRAMATTDGLTGVRNRAAFNERLSEEFDRAVRHERPLSVILMDVDHFKPFNDTFGHPAGDAVLKVVARTLQETARGTDFVARYGGEEFVALLPDTDYAGAMVVAERFRRAVAGQPWDKRAVTVSVGVSTFTATTGSPAELVEEADQALYRSKQAGRNRVLHRSGSVPTATTRRTAPV